MEKFDRTGGCLRCVASGCKEAGGARSLDDPAGCAVGTRSLPDHAPPTVRQAVQVHRLRADRPSLRPQGLFGLLCVACPQGSPCETPPSPSTSMSSAWRLPPLLRSTLRSLHLPGVPMAAHTAAMSRAASHHAPALQPAAARALAAPAATLPPLPPPPAERPATRRHAGSSSSMSASASSSIFSGSSSRRRMHTWRAAASSAASPELAGPPQQPHQAAYGMQLPAGGKRCAGGAAGGSWAGARWSGVGTSMPSNSPVQRGAATYNLPLCLPPPRLARTCPAA